MAKNNEPKKQLDEAAVFGLVRPRNIILVILAVLGAGAVFYHHVEGLSWLDSIYFCVVTLTTVGYGDITPQTDAGKIFTIFYILIGIGIIASSINYLAKKVAIKRIVKKHENNNEK